MIQTSVIIACVISLIICFALPIGSLLFMSSRKHRIVRPFLVGALAFVLSQVVTRIPLITFILPTMNWYIRLSMDPVANGLFLGFTAGLFEEFGRFILISLVLKKNRRYVDGLAFGFGHGGIEAILITGVSLINLMVLFISINSGTFDALMAKANTASANAVLQQCLAVTPLSMALAGIERILAVGLHIGLTMIVLTGIKVGKPWRFLTAAIVLHMLIDAAAVILPSLTSITTVGLELAVAAFTVPLIAYTVFVKKTYDRLDMKGEKHT